MSKHQDQTDFTGRQSALNTLLGWLRYQLPLFLHRPRLLWHRAWVRRDEFHQSLDIDFEAMVRMNKADQQLYMTDLIKRRNMAHERSNG